MTTAPVLLVLSTDLMTSVRIAETATALGYAAQTVDQAAGLSGQRADVLVLDVAACPLPVAEAVPAARALNPAVRTVALYRHTDAAQARAARAAGCDLVLNRAQFFGDLPAALGRVQTG
jgi:DNA-binding NarL/FixJ family response regulator